MVDSPCKFKSAPRSNFGAFNSLTFRICTYRQGKQGPLLTERPIKTNILQRIDALSRLLDFTSDDFGNEFCCQLRQAAAAGFALNNLRHFLTYGADLGCASIGSLFDLVRSSFGEGDGEQTKEIFIRGFDRNIGFDEGLPFANEGPKLVRGEVKPVEVGKAAFALHLVDS